MGYRRIAAVLMVASFALALAGCAATSVPSRDAAADITQRVLVTLDLSWHKLDLESERPATEPARWVLPNGWGFQLAQCMVDAGYTDYSYTASGGFLNGTRPPQTTGQEGLAWYNCSRRLPIYSTVYARPTEEQVDVLYDYYQSFLIPCLRSSGFPVSHVPEAANFAAGGDGVPGSWNPYLAIALPESRTIVGPLFERCPAYPADKLRVTG